MRRLDIEEVLGEIPQPDIFGGAHLIEYFFDIGPWEGEHHITWKSIESWCNLSGIQLEPWQCRLMVILSKAYIQQSQESRDWTSLSPWVPARNVWKYVCDQKNSAALISTLSEKVKEIPRNGNRK
jgi:hypothetical protein